MRWRGEFGGPPVGGMKREDVTGGRTKNEMSNASSLTRSVRRSGERDSGFEAGAAGSLERHSQERTGVASWVSPVAISVERPVEDGRELAFAGQQQQSEGVETTQQALAESDKPPGMRAEASPAIENIPTIAARAIWESRRWCRRSVMCKPELKLPKLTLTPVYVGVESRQAESPERIHLRTLTTTSGFANCSTRQKDPT
jgi:hypothetical protein